MIDSTIKSSFNTLLKLEEVTRFRKVITMFTDTRTEIPGSEEQAGFYLETAGSAVCSRGQ